MLYSRRSLLFLSSLSMLSFLFLKCSPGTRSLFFDSRRENADPVKFPNPYVEQGKALVSIVGGDDIKPMVREAVTLIGGLEKIDIKGNSILVKPNVVTGDRNPTTTSPEVIKAVIEILYEEGARKVVVGDMSGLMTFSTAWNMKKSGIKKAASDAGAELVCFEDYHWLEVKLPHTKYLKKISISEWIVKADRIVNLPVIKTHKYAAYSICLKNFIGATHWKQRPYFVDEGHWEEVVSDINQAYTPHLNIIDGTVSMIAGGPRKGTAVKTNVILASGDRIAGDVAGLGVIKSFDKCPAIADKGIWEQRQIKRAVEIGLGVGKGHVALRDKDIRGDSSDFKDLVQKVRKYIENEVPS